MHDQATDHSAPRRPATDAITNVALFLNVSAVVAVAICVGESGGIAVTAGIVALLCFVASLVCFAADNAANSDYALGLAETP
jgi:hypothetical protein